MYFFVRWKQKVLDSRYLKSLICVTDCGSIAEAARLEGLTGAAISQRVKALERQLGFALLSRAGHEAKPTEACLALLPRARRIVQEVSLLAGDADLEGLTGALRIGAISTALTGLLPRALQQLTRLAPGIKPSILPGTSRQLYQALQGDELDAALIVAPPFELPKAFRSQTLHQEPLVLLAGPGSPHGVLDALNSQAYISYDPSSWGGRHGQRYLRDQGLRPDAVYDLDGLEAIAMLVADGQGVSLVPRWSGLERIAPGLTITPVGEGYGREIMLVWRVQAERPGILDALLKALSH
jgi:DNA-binding transcriptional LysR family regulator